MCHQSVRPTSLGQNRGSGDGPAAPHEREAEPDPVAQNGDQNLNNENAQDSQSDPVTPVSTEERKNTEHSGEGDCGTADENSPMDHHVQGLCFSSSGDFVGFVSPESSRSLEAVSSFHPINMHNLSEVDGKEQSGDAQVGFTLDNSSLPQTTSDPVNQDAVENHSDSGSCSKWLQNNNGSCDGLEENCVITVTKVGWANRSELINSDVLCENGSDAILPEETHQTQIIESGSLNTDNQATARDLTPKSWNNHDSPKENDANKYSEVVSSGASPVMSQISIKPSNENS